MTKSTNHPAHGPVSVERLHQIREHLQHDTQYSNGGNRAYILADMLKVVDEVLASRTAEPVADVVAWHKEGEERTCDIRWRRFDVQPGPLYGIPPSSRLLLDELRRQIGSLLNSDGYRGADFDLLDYLKARDSIVDLFHSSNSCNS
ncbi:hypothetical protein [Citrobacter freundii]|uniref:hypothetical protein n=1 Tax=Citrobacter freundii TaxID=546 RepID=UPI001D14E3A4|nr:hypothetical protein [Citrobacter freundii]